MSKYGLEFQEEFYNDLNQSEQKELNANGWNFYKSGEFQFIMQGETEEDVRKEIAYHIQANNLDPDEHYTFQRFENHSNEGFEIKEFYYE